MDSEHDQTYGMNADGVGGDVTFLHGAARSADPLPRGQHDLSPEYVASHQRTRIQEATTHVVAERGYGAATIGDIVARAHVSRRTFYAHFETKDHAVLATFGASVECIADAVRRRYEAEAAWDAAIAAAMSELIRVLVEFPATARLCFVETRFVGAAAVNPLRSARGMAGDALRKVVARCPGAPPVNDMALELATEGLVGVIQARLAGDDPRVLERELADMTRALLEPLTGPEATDAVVSRLRPGAQGSAAHAI